MTCDRLLFHLLPCKSPRECRCQLSDARLLRGVDNSEEREPGLSHDLSWCVSCDLLASVYHVTTSFDEQLWRRLGNEEKCDSEVSSWRAVAPDGALVRAMARHSSSRLTIAPVGGWTGWPATARYCRPIHAEPIGAYGGLQELWRAIARTIVFFTKTVVLTFQHSWDDSVI